MDTLYDLADTSVSRPLLRPRHPWFAGHRHERGPSARPRKRIGKRLMLEPLEERMLLTAYLVTNAGDSGSGTGTSGTLRYVLSQLDSSGGATNTINFFLGTAQQTITPGSALPTITKQVDIIGGTVSGTSEPLVVINGGSEDTIAVGLDLESGSSGSRIQNLVIDGFDAYGIEDESADDSVTGCYIGTNGAGTAAVPNAQLGIDVEGSGATIGGTTTGARPMSSPETATTASTSMRPAWSRATTSARMRPAPPLCRTATTALMSTRRARRSAGPRPAPAKSSPETRHDGVYIDASCLVEGNEIGTNAAGTAAVPNAYDGIDVAASGATIGGTTAGAANIISGNTTYGIDIDASCLVEGNVIGTNAAGTAAVANGDYGIDVCRARERRSAGPRPATANVISGNTDYGIYIDRVLPGGGQRDRHECGRHRRCAQTPRRH